MRLLITGGGTGGHVYPALSVLEYFQPQPELLWVGKKGGMEEAIVERAGVPYHAIPAGGVRDLDWITRARSAVKLVQGFREAYQVLETFRPDVVLATGGYVTFPVGLAARLQGIPIIVYLPDIVPGLAVRALIPLAKKVAVSTPETARRMGRKATVTGYPVRRALARGKPKAQARATFEIPVDERVLLVTGGSQGSHSLNEAVGIFLPDYLRLAHVIHVHGKSDGEWLRTQRQALPRELQERYHLYTYLHEEMTDALLAADLVVARAGASTLGEFPAASLPAILVPFPSPGVNQEDNARWLEARGGAVVLNDAEVRMSLFPMVQAILSDPERLATMRQAMQAASRRDAAERIVALLRSYAKRVEKPKQEAQV